MIERRKTTASDVVTAVKMEQSHGLRKRPCRRRGPSGEASIGSRWEVNGIIDGTFESGEACEGGVLHVLEFRERGVDAPPMSRRISKLPVLATCGRDFSGVSKKLNPLFSSTGA